MILKAATRSNQAWGLQQRWMLVAATGLGVLLRFYELPRQILVDDEWHAVHKLLDSDYFSIVTDLGATDHCIPLTLLYSLLADFAVLNELWMRLPAFLSGIVLVPTLPILLRCYVGSNASVALAWLLAVSPFHIYYSRLARPYSITLLLSWLAVVAFYRWWRGGHSGWKWVYTVAAVLSPWFHLVTLPVVLAPPALAAVDVARGRGRSPADWLLAVVGTGVGQIVLLGPPLVLRFGSLSNKLSVGSPTIETFAGAVELFMGTIQPWLLIGCGALMLVGVLPLARGQADFLKLIFFTGFAQVGALLLLGPHYIEVPVTLARYALFLLPAALLLIATGISRISTGLVPGTRSVAGWVTLVVAAFLFWFGPLPRILRYPNNWMGQGTWQIDYHHDRALERFRPKAAPMVYDELASLPVGATLVLEAPWHYNWQYFPYYQQQHRQRTAIGFVAPPAGPARPGETLLNDPRFRWTNAIHVFDHGELIRQEVDWVIFHKQLSREMPPPYQVDTVDVSPWIRHYETLFGPPRFEDDFVAAFMIRNRRVPLERQRFAETPENDNPEGN